MTRRCCKGQALAETLVALLMLVPMLLALQAIAEVQIGAARATQTARLLALGSALTGRSLDTAALVAQAPELLAENPAAGRWRGLVQREAEPRAAAEATRAVAVALAPAELLAGGSLPLERNGWLVAEGQVPVEPAPVLRAVLGAAPLQLTSRMTLLTEDFQATGRAEVLQRMSRLDAMRPMRRTVSALRPLTRLLSVFDPPFRNLCAQLPDPDVLPADRLSFVAVRPAVACR